MNILKGTTGFALRFIVSIAVLLWLFSKVDLAKIAHALSRIPLGDWCLAFSLYLTAQFLSSLRWYLIGHSLGFGGKFFKYLVYYFIGMYFNLFLPSAIGGDVLKIYFLARDGNGKLKASYSILADRFFGLWAMFIIGALTVILHPGLLPEKWRVILILIFLATGIGALIAPIFRNWILRLQEHPLFSGNRASRILSGIDFMMTFWKHPLNLGLCLCLSLALQLCGMLCVFVLGQALGIGLDLAYYFAVMPLINIITILPISLSGLGIREGGFAFFFGIKGIAIGEAITLSLGFFAIQALAALIGGVAYMAGAHKSSESTG